MFNLPTLGGLVQRARQEFRANLKGSDASIWPNNVYAVGKVLGGIGSQIVGFMSYVSRQKFAHTAPDLESLGLHGAEFGIPQNPAAPSRGPLVISSPVAVEFEEAAVFRRADGAEFLSVGAYSMAGAGDLQVQVIARRDGIAGNTPEGAVLEIVSGMTGGEDAVAVVGEGGVTLGLDVEDIESWRARILFRKRNPSHGGSAADYVWWSGQVAGVTFYSDRPTVYVERTWAGPGTVRVFPLMMDLYPDGIPSDADLARVRSYLDSVAPAGVVLSVSKPFRKVVDITITGLYPNTVTTREAVLAELRDAFRRLSRVAGRDKQLPEMPFLSYPTVFSRSWIWQAVANSTGEQRHVVTYPADDVPLTPGEMAVMGNVTFLEA